MVMTASICEHHFYTEMKVWISINQKKDCILHNFFCFKKW